MEQCIQSYYAVIPADVRYDARLTANAKLLYGEITALCNAKGFCWADNKCFARLYSTSERTVQRWIESLANLGYIVKNYAYDDNGIATERYISIQMHRLSPHDKNVIPPMTKMSFPPYNPPNNENILNYNNNPPKPPKGGSAKEQENFIDESSLSDELKSAVKMWVAYKKEQHKFTYKDTSFKMLLRQLEFRERDFGAKEVIDVINYSIENGYKGILWDKLEKKKKREKRTYTASELNAQFDDLKYEDL